MTITAPIRDIKAATLIEAVDQKAPHLVDLIDLAIQTGARKAELLRLEWNRIDWSNNEIMLEARNETICNRL